VLAGLFAAWVSVTTTFGHRRRGREGAHASVAHAGHGNALMVLGGSALFLAGHAAFKAVVWRMLPDSRLAAIVVLGLLGFLAPHVSAFALGGCAGAVLIALVLSDGGSPPPLVRTRGALRLDARSAQAPPFPSL
jgi:hypothetical protein